MQWILSLLIGKTCSKHWREDAKILMKIRVQKTAETGTVHGENGENNGHNYEMENCLLWNTGTQRLTD